MAAAITSGPMLAPSRRAHCCRRRCAATKSPSRRSPLRPLPHASRRQQPLASCSGRAPAPAAARALLPPGRRRAAVAAAAVAGDSSPQGDQGLLAGRRVVKQMEFSYMSAADAAEAEAAAEAAWQMGMQEYADLQVGLCAWFCGVLLHAACRDVP